MFCGCTSKCGLKHYVYVSIRQQMTSLCVLLRSPWFSLIFHSCPSFSHGFPMVFLWFSIVFPWVFLLFSHGFSIVFHRFPIVFPWFSYAFRGFFPPSFVPSPASPSPKLRRSDGRELSQPGERHQRRLASHGADSRLAAARREWSALNLWRFINIHKYHKFRCFSLIFPISTFSWFGDFPWQRFITRGVYMYIYIYIYIY